ncbi:MAG TPA: urea amidolyase family protein [Arachnia sp.]|nr:urea amidolyase family protein [Arachnia sp.]HMR13464.1 urea amidolyase family protein [Arachnia sp.]
MRVLPCGAHALLLEFDALDEVLAAHARLRGEVDAELVPAARTLLVTARGIAGSASALASLLADELGSAAEPAGREVEVPVIYDGDDLAEVARLSGLSVREVIEAHAGTPWRAAFGGFAPGFVYLVGGDPRLRVPRLTSPRTRVPAGSVALADEFSGVYPTASPGGWRLLGRTDVALFDPAMSPPALMAPGDTVRFVARAPSIAAISTENCGNPDLPSPRAPESSSWCSYSSNSRLRRLVVGRTLLPVLVQDGGRPGLGAVGVSPSGAADRGAYELGQRMVGNELGEAALEITMGQAAFTAVGAMTAALTGAPCPATVGGRAVSHATVFTIGDGETLTLGAPTSGLRTYLSVRGGVDVQPVLGSRSRDTLGGLGPAPLLAGDGVGIGEAAPGWAPAVDHVAQPAWPRVAILRYLPGPRADWAEGLAGSAWAVGAAVDRVGARLVGPPLSRRGGELPSEGVVRGAIQLPPSGQPVLFLADHPPTGGYPVVGILSADSADAAAQLRPGDPVRLEPN